MRVLLVDPFSEVGGQETVVLRLLAGLDKSRFSATLLCPAEGRLTEAARANGIDCRVFPLEMSTFGPNLARQAFAVSRGTRGLAQLIRGGGYDLIHANSHLIGPVCTLAARWSRVPSLWHIHAIYQTTSLRRRVIVELARRLPDAIVAVSDVAAAQFLPCSKLERIYNGIDVDAYAAMADRAAARREFGFAPDHLVVGCMGRLSPQKGQDIFLDAARLIVAEYDQARFLVVGDEALGEVGFKGHLQTLARDLGISTRTVFAGYRSDAASMSAAVDVFVHPGVVPESLGMTVLEAMALEKPVVATAVGAIPELVEDGRTGFLVPPGNPTALARAVVRLLAHPALAASMATSGRQRAVDQFSWQGHVQQFEGLYLRLARTRCREIE